MTYLRSAFGLAVIALALFGLKASAPAAPMQVAAMPLRCPLPKPVIRQVGSSYEREVVRLTNIERTSRGLRPLKINAEMFRFSRNWSTTQAASRMHHSRGPYAENVAAGYQTPSDVVRAWMNSKGHRANILNGRYTEIGVGNSGRFWTQTFR
jgi:uncharacterized protein YkwD